MTPSNSLIDRLTGKLVGGIHRAARQSLRPEPPPALQPRRLLTAPRARIAHHTAWPPRRARRDSRILEHRLVRLPDGSIRPLATRRDRKRLHRFVRALSPASPSILSKRIADEHRDRLAGTMPHTSVNGRRVF